MDILIQAIGGIGYAMLSFSYFKKNKISILLTQIIAYIMFTIHYYMLNGVTGVICNITGGAALIIIYLLEKYKVNKKNVLIVCLALIIGVISMLTYQNIYSVFPTVAAMSVILSFISNSENEIRAVGFISAVCWLVYAIIYKSYISIVFEAVTLVFVAVATIKNYKNNK